VSSKAVVKQRSANDVRLTRIADELQQEVIEAERHYQSAVQHAIRAGELLNEARVLVARGTWGKWLAANFEASETVAATYMRLADHRAEIASARTITAAVGMIAASSRGPATDDKQSEPDPMAAYRRASSAVSRALAHAEDWTPESDLPPGYVPVPELRGSVERLLEIVSQWEHTPRKRARRATAT